MMLMMLYIVVTHFCIAFSSFCCKSLRGDELVCITSTKIESTLKSGAPLCGASTGVQGAGYNRRLT